MRWFRRMAILGVVLGTIGVFCAAGSWWWLVVAHPGAHLTREHILSVISQESPVYFRGGTEKIGVFFQEEHRQYVPFARIPRPFVLGLVAAEDQDFFDHPGFSLRGISRAMLHNALAGRTVAGGSTLTQQTAKNLFKRRGRTLMEKLRELANALRLEHYFGKEDILEFYSNQFYVNGNGRGLGIAARWFFDKDVHDLSLHECAFLAGVVKSPERYNPFVVGQERRAKAEAAAVVRTGYVLDRMLALGSIDQATWNTLKGSPIPFHRGRFRFERSVVLDEVERELARPEIRRALVAHGIDDPGRAGLAIETTVDRTIQDGAVYGFRHHLTEIGTLLDGPPVEALFLEEGAPRPTDADTGRPHSFHAGVLLGVDLVARTARFDLGGQEAWVDADGNGRMATARLRARGKNTWVEAKPKDVAAFLQELEAFVGRQALLSVREVGADGRPILDWEYTTRLQGAVVVLDDGEVRALVGGTTNAEFNRAVAAKRQFGSTWKPVVYQAALQLGWLPTDALDNTRQVFPYQATYYFPRPDHKGAPDRVSMGWAAAKSENLASIWLLYHLCDKLNAEQFRIVAESVGLVQGGLEDRDAWIARLQGEGIMASPERRRAAIYELARAELAPDLDFDGREEEGRRLSRIPYGAGFAEERGRLPRNKALDKVERDTRRTLLERHFLALLDSADEFQSRREGIVAAWREGRPPELRGLFVAEVGESGSLIWSARTPEGFRALELADLPLTPTVPEPASQGLVMLDDGVVDVEGLVSVATLRRLSNRVEEITGPGDTDLWSWEELSRLRDFRVLVALKYMARLANNAGVRTRIQPVLSLPLGASEVSLVEMALLYQGFWTGGRSRFFADPLIPTPPGEPSLEVGPTPDNPPFSIIAEIRRGDGTVIYRAAREMERTQPPELSASMAGMLRAVVTHGTGSRAEGAVLLRSQDPKRNGELVAAPVAVPLFGKTGTTNSYKNAAFVGFVPTLPEGRSRLRPGDGMTVAAYVGYDDNAEMKRGGIRLMGASATLPLWLATAQAIVDASGLADDVELPAPTNSGADVLSLEWPEEVQPVSVGTVDGLPLAEGDEAPSATLFVPREGARFAPAATILPPPPEPDVEEGGPEATPEDGNPGVEETTSVPDAAGSQGSGAAGSGEPDPSPEGGTSTP